MKLTKQEKEFVKICEHNADRFLKERIGQIEKGEVQHPYHWESSRLCRIIRRLTKHK